MMKLTTGISQAFEELGRSNKEIAALQKQARIETVWAEICKKIFPRSGDYILLHTNAIYYLTENGVTELSVYLDDATAKSDVVAHQGLLQIAFKRAGLPFHKFKALSSARSIRQRHPYAVLEEAPSVNFQHERKLTELDKLEIVQQAAEIEDTAVKRAFIEAFAATLKYDF